MFVSFVRNGIIILLGFSLFACSNTASTDSGNDTNISSTTDGGNGTDLPFTSEEIVFNGLQYMTIRSPRTGKVWLDRNLGASRLCESATDEICFGDFYQWGRSTDGHEKSTSTVSDVKLNTLVNTSAEFIGATDWLEDGVDDDGSLRSFEWSKTDGSSVCPVGFRVPTITELVDETTDNTITNSATAYTSFWKIPTGKYRGYLGPITSWNETTCLWSTSVPFQYHANPLCFDQDGVYTSSNTYHGMGHHIRCIKD